MGDLTDNTNYHPILGLTHNGKLFEYLLDKKIKNRFISIISIDQHGFIPGRSTVTNMVDFTFYVLDTFETHLHQTTIKIFNS